MKNPKAQTIPSLLLISGILLFGGIMQTRADTVATTTVYTGAFGGEYHATVPLSAMVLDASNLPATGTEVHFSLVPLHFPGPELQGCSGTVDAAGEASCSLQIQQELGSYTIIATALGDNHYAPSSTSFEPFQVMVNSTATAYTGAIAGEYLKTVTLSAFVFAVGGAFPTGTEVHFSLGQPELQGCSGTVDAAGNASCSLQIQQPAGSYPIIATALGDNHFTPSSTSATFMVSGTGTSLVYTGPSLSANGVPLSVSARFTDTSAGTPIAGRAISFVLGAQGCSGVTNASGEASCTIASVSQPLGPASITANFAGDGFYLPKSTTSSVLVFEYATGGSFVIGRSQAIVHSDVTFWGAKWTKLNMPGAPPPFKGFAPQQTRPACGAGFRFALGSVNPPATVPAYMAVIASTFITQSGSSDVGDSPEIVIVRTAAGYTPDPGNPGTGTVVAVVCGGLPFPIP